MFKKVSVVLLSIAFAVTAAACGTSAPAANNGTEVQGSQTQSEQAAPQELTIKHKLGETKVKKNPQKVVVFDFGILDSLDKLGIEVAGVAQASIPPYLSKYKDAKYANVGSLKEPDFEKISELSPDLIIISGRQQEAYEELSKLGPTIFLGVDTAKYMESYKENNMIVGQIFGKEAEVEAELKKVEDTIASVSEKAKASGKNALIILANEGNISAYGAGSRFGIIHDVLGFAPVDTSIKVDGAHGQSVSPEYIVEKNPDYLFVIDRGSAIGGESSAKSVVENELVKKTKAFQNGNVVYLDSNYWYLSGGGLISVEEMVKEVEKAIK